MKNMTAAGALTLFCMALLAGPGPGYADLIVADSSEYPLIGIGTKNPAPDNKQDTLLNVDYLLDEYYDLYYNRYIETVFIGKLEQEDDDPGLEFSWNDLHFTLSRYEPDGTWTVTNTGTSEWTSPIWYSLESSTGFGLFDSGISVLPAPGGTTVSWRTIALNENGTFQDLSHISFWTEKSSPVPEPATMLLFGTGLVGLAGIFLKKKKK